MEMTLVAVSSSTYNSTPPREVHGGGDHLTVWPDSRLQTDLSFKGQIGGRAEGTRLRLGAIHRRNGGIGHSLGSLLSDSGVREGRFGIGDGLGRLDRRARQHGCRKQADQAFLDKSTG